MQNARWLNRLPWASAMLALIVGIATRDCVLVASAALLAIYLARLDLHTREAVDMMRCAMHCWVFGAGSILIATALLLWVLVSRVINFGIRKVPNFRVRLGAKHNNS